MPSIRIVKPGEARNGKSILNLFRLLMMAAPVIPMIWSLLEKLSGTRVDIPVRRGKKAAGGSIGKAAKAAGRGGEESLDEAHYSDNPPAAKREVLKKTGFLKTVFILFKETAKEWSEDKVPRLAAALSYYTIFSIAPLLVICIAVAGLLFGQEAAQGQIVGQIRGLVGEQGAETIQGLLQSARKPSESIIATLIGVVTLLLGASGVFGQLQDALNTIWEVKPRPGKPWYSIITDRFTSFSMVLVIGFLLLTSMVLSAGLAALGGWLDRMMPGLEALMQVGNFVLSFGIITVLFAMIYKILPDARIRWNDVWVGAAVTALLFTLGKLGIGLYLGHSSVGSSYGAAGSFVVILLWIFYSSQIIFFGAEFTQVYASILGSRVRPDKDAVHVTEAERLQQGMGLKDLKDAKEKVGASQAAPARKEAMKKGEEDRLFRTAGSEEVLSAPQGEGRDISHGKEAKASSQGSGEKSREREEKARHEEGILAKIEEYRKYLPFVLRYRFLLAGLLTVITITVLSILGYVGTLIGFGASDAEIGRPVLTHTSILQALFGSAVLSLLFYPLAALLERSWLRRHDMNFALSALLVTALVFLVTGGIAYGIGAAASSGSGAEGGMPFPLVLGLSIGGFCAVTTLAFWIYLRRANAIILAAGAKYAKKKANKLNPLREGTYLGDKLHEAGDKLHQAKDRLRLGT